MTIVEINAWLVNAGWVGLINYEPNICENRKLHVQQYSEYSQARPMGQEKTCGLMCPCIDIGP